MSVFICPPASVFYLLSFYFNSLQVFVVGVFLSAALDDKTVCRQGHIFRMEQHSKAKSDTYSIGPGVCFDMLKWV
jgi:hypothetical protein